jgi:hypothetical protein
MTQRVLVRGLAAAWLGFSLLVLSAARVPAAAAARPPVSVGDVAVAVDGVGAEATPELRGALRRALSEELEELAKTGLALRHPLVVSATLTKLSSERRAERSRVSAVISLALRRADDQVLFAELRGRASAEESTGNLASVRSAALRGAVRGAVGRLPEAVERRADSRLCRENRGPP